MRNGRLFSSRAVACLVLLVGVATPASAVFGLEGADTAAVATPYPAAASGDMSLHAREWALLIRGDGATLSDSGMAVSIAAGELELTIVSVEFEVLEAPFGTTAHSPRYREDVYVYRRANATIASPGETFEVLLHPAEGTTLLRARFPACENLAVGAASVPFEHSYGVRLDMRYFHGYRLPEDSLEVHLRAGRSTCAPTEAFVAGRIEVFVADAQLRIVSEAGTVAHSLGFVRESRAAPDGSSGPLFVDRYSFAVVRAADADAVVGWDGPEGVLAVVDPLMHLEGTIDFREAEGGVSADDRRFALSGDTSISGTIDFRVLRMDEESPLAPLAPKRMHGFEVSGAIREVWLGGSLVFRASLAEEAALLVLLATIIAFMTREGRVLLSALVGPLYTRLGRSEVLAHLTRRRMLEAVKENPGVHVRELCRQTGLAWGLFYYHLRVLQRHGFVVKRRQGKHGCLYTTDDGQVSLERALSLRGLAADIYRALPTEGGLTQDALSQRLGKSVQLVSYHLRRLEREGVVQATVQRPRRYMRAREAHEIARGAGESGGT